MAAPELDPVLRLDHVSKSFMGVRVLHDVSLQVNRGEIRALVGQNGSGKSTLIKILTGYHDPDPGARMRWWGEEVEFPIRSPRSAGIAVIHQDLGLAGGLSVLENFGVGSRYGAASRRPVGWTRERRRCRQLCARFDVELDLDRMVADLEPAERAMLAIVRAVRQLEDGGECQLFILDEPTTYLARDAADRVMTLIRQVASGGAVVLFVTHRLSEVTTVCDSVTVLRDGRAAATMRSQETDHDRIVELMLGRRIGDFYPAKRPPRVGQPLLRVLRLRGEVVDDVSFDLHAGEIFGVTGLVGMGHDELPYLIVGERPRRGGEVRVLPADRPLAPSPRAAIAERIGLVPANREQDSIWFDATALENVTLPVLRRYRIGGRLRLARERNDVADLLNRFGVLPPAPDRPAGTFSGGNQQKLVLAKWLQLRPSVLLLHEPTQGVDAGARKDLLELVRAHVDRGTGAAMFSADYEQLARVCDRVMVLHHGTVAAVLEGPALTEERLVRVCQGLAVSGAAGAVP